jgi:hypothetical protein
MLLFTFLNAFLNRKSTKVLRKKRWLGCIISGVFLVQTESATLCFFYRIQSNTLEVLSVHECFACTFSTGDGWNAIANQIKGLGAIQPSLQLC